MRCMDFATFIQKVEAKVNCVLGTDLDSLGDHIELDVLWDDGVSPSEAARQVMEAAGWNDQWAF